MTSGMAPEFEPITGTPQPIASTMTRPYCSCHTGDGREGTTRTSMADRNRATPSGSSVPANRAASPRPASRACASREARAGPSPAIASCAGAPSAATASINVSTPFSGASRPTKPTVNVSGRGTVR